MKSFRSVMALLCAVACVLPALPASGAEPAEKIRVLVVTGGHKFEVEPFFQMFKDNPGITYEAVEHPNAHAKFRPEAAQQYDVVVFYDMWQNIPEEAKADFLGLTKAGKGLVVLHHALVGYQEWPDYARLVGGKYRLKPKGTNAPAENFSTFKHDVNLRVRVAAPDHPVTAGLSDFEILDEVYGNFDVYPGVTRLLTTDHLESTPVVGWAKEQERSRVVYLQGGHDHHAFENPNYRRLLANAIRWTARRD